MSPAELVERCAEKLHEGCQSCDGTGSILENYGARIVRVYECEAHAQAVDVVRCLLTQVSVQDWRIVRLVDADEYTETACFDPPADVDPFNVPSWVVVAEWEPVR